MVPFLNDFVLAFNKIFFVIFIVLHEYLD